MEVVVCIGFGLLFGAAIALFSGFLEFFLFNILWYLEGKGMVTRIAPSISTPRRSTYNFHSFWLLCITYAPGFGLMVALRERYKENCRWNEFDMFGGLIFNFILMIIQDANFFLIHTMLHKVKALYTLIHQTHHCSQLDITVYSSSHAEVLDTVAQFTPFYLLLAIYFYWCPSWNLWSFVIHMFFIISYHTLGHCGYHLPALVHVPFSLGITLTPGSQLPLHHYIHHLDPRYNRSLYFLWWDIIFGTYQNKHPKIPSSNKKPKASSTHL